MITSLVVVWVAFWVATTASVSLGKRYSRRIITAGHNRKWCQPLNGSLTYVPAVLEVLQLGIDHWMVIIGSDNGLSPGWCQAIIWTNAGILFIGPSGTNFSEILIDVLTVSFKKMCFKGSSAKWWRFWLSLNVLRATIGPLMGILFIPYIHTLVHLSFQLFSFFNSNSNFVLVTCDSRFICIICIYLYSCICMLY